MIENKLQLNEKAWIELFNKYDIPRKVDKEGMFEISADQIKEFREPRLMTKFDTKESLPKIFNNMSILPNSRGTYLIGYFDTYEEFPPIEREIHHVYFPEYLETIDKDNINSEANAINAICISGILDDFLEDDEFLHTISGKMSSGIFKFNIYDKKFKKYVNINVNNSQIEIDAGFENMNSICLIEAKNIVHDNFIVRQLYYPLRCWKNKVSKPIRTVFMIYSNNIFRLIEYEFTDVNNYNSIRFIKQKNYSFEVVTISLDDLIDIYKNSKSLPEPEGVPFLQANNFNTVISLLELLNEEELTPSEIADKIGFDIRQSDYYFNAARYLGLAEKITDYDSSIKMQLTKRGKQLFKLSHKQRQLKFVEYMFEHEILRYSFKLALELGRIPDKYMLQPKILELNLCKERVSERRASTVSSWTKWIFNIVND